MTEKKVCPGCLVEKCMEHFSISNVKYNTIYKKKFCKLCCNKMTKVRNELKKTAPPKPDICDCCGKITSRFCLDHDHKTNKFRGWICDDCNTGIGKLGDTKEGLKTAYDYLVECNFK